MKTGLVLLLVVSLALATENDSMFSQIREMSSTSSFAREMAGLLELQMSQGGVDEVLTLIRDLLNQMKGDQQTEDAEFAQQLGTLNVDIGILEYLVERLGNQLRTANTQIGDLQTELNALTVTLTSLQTQFTLLNGREEDLRNGRQSDEQDYKNRGNNSRRVIEALNQILAKLGEAVFAQEGRQSAVLSQVQMSIAVKKIKEELGASHPIAALVSLTTQFDVPTVKRVIERIENLRDSILSSQVSDDKQEVESQSQFQVVIKEVVDVRERLNSDATVTKGLIARRNNEKIIAERTKSQVSRDLPLTQEILTNTRNQRDVVEANYNNRRAQRGEELRIIQSAYQLVQQQADRIRARQ